MKLYLFGGAETDLGQTPVLVQLINDALAEIKPRQLLHIPYARMKVPEGEKEIWGEGWVSKKLNLKGIELLDHDLSTPRSCQRSMGKAFTG